MCTCTVYNYCVHVHISKYGVHVNKYFIYILNMVNITKQINAMTEEDSLFSCLLYTIVKAQTKVRSMVK